MQISLGFSPCPNDTFIFDALVHNRIDTEGIDFQFVMADVEELNRRAFAGDLDVTKLSYHALGWLLDRYALLEAGSALGWKCGPLLIARRAFDPAEINLARIAIPGKYTTANFLLSIAFPNATNKTELLFSDIEQAVLDGRADAGLIIHENRFTYQSKGLIKIMDLGDHWETLTGLPIPLGGIAVKRSLPGEIQQKINRLLQASVEFAFKNPEASKNFVKRHAQEMEEDVMNAHINLYVNDYTVSLGKTGKSAVFKLFETARERGVIPSYKEKILIN